MSKRSATTLDTFPAYDRYRPHNRSDTWFTGEVLDPVTGEVVKQPSMTKQSFVDSTDINLIMKQFTPRQQALLMSQAAQGGMYTDLPDDLDYQEAQNTRIRAEQAFATLPSKVRTRFENDPAQFLEFMADPQNADEMVSLGLATKRATDAPNGPQAPSTPADPATAPDGSSNAPAA